MNEPSHIPVLSQNDFPQAKLTPRFHESDIRAVIALIIFLAGLTLVALKLHYASVVLFKDACSIDQFFDPIIAGLGGALTTVLGFYFADRRRS